MVEWFAAAPSTLSLSDNSMTVASTQRTVLRRFCEGDLDPMIAVFGDPDVMRFGDGPQSVDWIRCWIEQTIKHYEQIKRVRTL